jgi:hypothetical protein
MNSQAPAAGPIMPAPYRQPVTSQIPVQRMAAPAVASTAMPEPPAGGEVINGFGNQVPLVMALREIVPASYQFAYATGLPLGTLVSWKGGRSWQAVLQDVLSPLGLTAMEKGSVIYIGSGSRASAMATP